MYRDMFNFFSRQNQTSCNKGITSFYTILSQDERVTYAICKATDLCKAINVDVSLLNRTVDIEHKNDLLNELINNHHFMGSIKLVHESNELGDRYRIIDGQHRYISLYEYINRNKEYDCDIQLLLEIYEVDDINGEHARDLFRMANTVKNIDYTRDVASVVSGGKKSYEDLLVKLMTLYPNTIKDNTRVQYPNISAKDLKEQLRDRKLLQKYETDELIKIIIGINNTLLTKDMRYFFGEDYRESKNYDRFLTAFVRAKNNKCFLGLLKTGKMFNFVNEI
jgi:hypothetical protein